ncbi:hypothetical protein D8674_026359 [Pyrus ussuriensis x Pyrus communis]|uniref:Uncharacterized protein n=1 Tax=Pyrus ussuriensis x Pyrus communis TaxID=2448454 RepID=A0A5N5I6L5_9ROSA|nr:hypothetical protein D8674_026359 [Pyrus ussuriensis x Pyrus communis]
MNHNHHPRQIAANNPERDFSLPPSASTADNAFKISVPASPCGGSLPNMTTPYSPDRYHFSKSQSQSPARVLPPLSPPHTLRRSVSDLNHSPAKTSSRSSTSSQDFHFSTDLDTPDSKGLSRMKDRLRETCKIPPLCRTVSDVYACANSEEESAFPETVYRKIPPLRRCFSEPYKLPSATTDQPFGSTPNPNRFQPAPDCLVIHFRCHCDKAYQFLLSGGNCYYKLM